MSWESFFHILLIVVKNYKQYHSITFFSFILIVIIIFNDIICSQIILKSFDISYILFVVILNLFLYNYILDMKFRIISLYVMYITTNNVDNVGNKIQLIIIVAVN